MSKEKTVLVADDDIRVVKALMLRFGQINLKVITATDGYNALKLAIEHKPDLLVLDINMPAGDGFSVQERMKKTPEIAHIPVIYITGDKSQRLDDLAEQLGAYAVVHKPFQIEYLIDTVLNAISPQRAA